MFFNRSSRQKKKKPGRLRGLKALCVAFAAAAGLAGCGSAPLTWSEISGQSNGQGGSSASESVPATPPPEPRLLEVFGQSAIRARLNKSPFDSRWDQMLSNQRYYLKNPKWAQEYRDFLDQFNKDRGKPLLQMADNVNAVDLSEITYNDDMDCTTPNTTTQDCNPYNVIWPSPLLTALDGKGNCIDQAILQYFILRYLGVPADRLFIANVNASGDPVSVGADHSVLLLNTAPAGFKPNFLVLNDGGPVVSPDRYISHGKIPFKPLVFSCNSGECQTWNKPYTFYDAFNEYNSWLTPNTPYEYISNESGSRPLSSSPASPGRAKPGMKMG